MGLESLSRGARKAVFFEADRSAIGRLKQNIATLKVETRAQVIPGDLFKWFATARPMEDQRPTVIFLDPPYRFVVEKSEQIRELVREMLEHHLAPGGYIVLRHDASDSLAFSGVKEIDKREYGSMVLRFLARPAD